MQMKPAIMPLGDTSVLVRFDTKLSEGANSAALALAAVLEENSPHGVLEIMPNLVSVLLRYDPGLIGWSELSGELRLILSRLDRDALRGRHWTVKTTFDGPDIDEVAAVLGMRVHQFISAHNSDPLRVLATGFAPGFVYCGLHKPELVLPRRSAVRPMVAAGSVLFAAGQTAIAATEMPTGWHVIGHTTFRNFDSTQTPPTILKAGDVVTFRASG